MNFKTEKCFISDLKIITPKIFADSRGYFFESYKSSSFKEIGIADDFIQTNQSFSYQNVIRGLHFQTEKYAQAKLVRCLIGEIYDVAVDLRKNSATFGKFFGINLSAKNRKMLYIPVGFAHGFSVLSNSAEICYEVAASEYHQPSEEGIRFNDETLKIDWQINNPIVSDKDQKLPFFDKNKIYF
jgi:dTDP-4-dehydrorhamnose 3,5-epimerase